MTTAFLVMAALTMGAVDPEIASTLAQIEALQAEVDRNEALVEERITDLRATNPLFAEKDPFESNVEYLARMSRAMPQIDRLRKQYLADIWHKLSILRGRLFETREIDVAADPASYDADNEVWPITIDHLGHQLEHFEVTLSIPKAQARELARNWERVRKTGTLAIDAGDRIGLAKFELVGPVSGFRFSREFHPMAHFGDSSMVSSVAFSPNGSYLATGDAVYSLQTGELVMRTAKIVIRAFSPDGKYVATGGPDDTARIYSIETGQEIRSWGIGGSVRSVAFSPDGQYLAAAGEQAPARIYSIESGQEVWRRLSASIATINSVAFSPDGKYLAWGGHDHFARIHSIETGKAVRSWDAGNNNYINSVAFSPDGRYLAAGSGDDARARIFNVETGKEVKYWKHRGSAPAVAFSPDGKYLAAGGDDARIYSIETGFVVKSWSIGESVRSVAFSPDGKYLATGSDNGAPVYRTLFRVEESVLATKQIARPPQLAATVAFIEPSGNRALDALEEGSFRVTLRNTGAGPAKGIPIRGVPERIDGLNYDTAYVEEIPAGDEVVVEVPVAAYLEVAAATHTLRFTFDEVNGFPPDPVEVEFSTRAYARPDLFIVDVGIEDASGDGMIQSGEVVTLTVRFGNRGDGAADGAYARFYAGDHAFLTDTHPKTVNLGDLRRGGSIDVPLEFFVNNKAADAIPLYVDLTEATGLAGAEKVRVPVKKSARARRIQRTVVEAAAEPELEGAWAADLSIDVEKDIPTAKQGNQDAVAVVIGNRNYRNADVPSVDFATRDAALMRQYLVGALGYDESNILYATDATQGELLSLFGTEKHPGKLQNYVRAGQSDVFVYYSGHGAPDPESKGAYLVPVDCDPSLVAVNGYSVDLFYRQLKGLGARSVTVAIDACFSGGSAAGMLLKNVSPVFIEVDRSMDVGTDGAVFSSAGGEQVSSWYPEKKHSLFTYYFLKGLQGAADADENRELTVGELHDYVAGKVPQMARRLNNREQTPGLATAERNRVLARY